ncbi:P110/LppT family adhesin N-terminal domain [Mesomycoplasma conjunctivae]|uniref:P110/LppT family adhesin N-terminal domain n=1 Tax=Mesomycoplasma conjunctivae TaxID=45361 RepID=UPI003DA59641
MKFNLKSTKTLVGLIALSTALLTMIVAIPVGRSYYQKSYDSKFNRNLGPQKTIELANNLKISYDKFKQEIDDLKFKDNFHLLSAETALSLHNDKLQDFSLLSAFDFSSLTSKGFSLAIDTSQASLSTNAIENVIIHAYNQQEKLNYSYKTNLKNFAAANSSQSATTFDISSNSTIKAEIKGFVLPSDYQELLETQFTKNYSELKNVSLAFSKTLVQLNAHFNLLDQIGLPTILNPGFQLVPVTQDAAASQGQTQQTPQIKFVKSDDQTGELILEFQLVDGQQKIVKTLNLKIENLTNKQTIEDNIAKQINSLFQDNFRIKQDLLEALKKDNTTFIDYIAASQSSNTSELSTKFSNVNTEIEKQVNLPDDKPYLSFSKSDSKSSELFKYFDKPFVDNRALSIKINNQKFEIKNITFDPSIKDRLAELKAKGAISLNFSLKTNEGTTKLKTDYSIDVKIDNNTYEEQLFSALGQQKTNFSLPQDKNQALVFQSSAKKALQNLIDSLKLATLSAEQISSLIKDSYLLNNGREITSQESQTLIAESKKLTNINLEKLATIFPENSISRKIVELLTKVNTAKLFADEQASLKLEVVNYSFNAPAIQISAHKDGKMVASAHLIINNVAPDNLAYNVAQQYNVDFFLDGRSGIVDKTEMKKPNIDIRGVNRGDLEFNIDGAQVTKRGLVLSKKIDLDQFSAINPFAKLKAASTQSDDMEKEKDAVDKLYKKTQSKSPLSLDTGVAYLAFSLNKLKDYKKYYLLSDATGANGIFIQRVDKLQANAKQSTMEGKDIASKNDGVSYVIGVDTTLKGKKTSKALIISGPLYEEVKKHLNGDNTQAYFNLLDNKSDNTKSPSLNLNNTKEDILSRAFSGNNTTTSIEVDSNLFLQSLNQEDPSSHNGGLRDNEILLISIVKTKASIEISLQTSNSYDSRSDTIESSLSQIKLSFDLVAPNSPKMQNVTDFQLENSFNWNKLGFDAETNDSETKFILKGFAIFNDPRLVANKLANKNIRKAFVDTYLIKK